jgi:hypothetical protein
MVHLRNVCRVVVVTLLESLGSDAVNPLVFCRRATISQQFYSHISHTVASKHNSRSKLLLRETRNIAANHRQAHAETKTLEVTQPQRNQASPSGAIRQANKHRGASNADKVGNHHSRAARVGPLAADEAASEQSSKLHETTGDLQVLGTKSVEAEVLDDQRSETCDGGVGNLSGHSQNEENPSLGVGNSLPGLVDLEVVVLDTLSVGGNSLDGDGALSLVKEPCR